MYVFISLVILISLTGIIGFLILLFGYRHIYSQPWKQISYYGILYFLTTFFNWLNLLFNICFPQYLLLTNMIWCFTVISNPVFLFRMVECYKGVNQDSIGRPISYGIPIAGFLVVVLMFFSQLTSQPFNELSFLLDHNPAVILISVIGSAYMFMNLYILMGDKHTDKKRQSGVSNRPDLSDIFKAISLILLIMSPIWFIFIPEGTLFLITTSLLMLTFSILHILLISHIITLGGDSKQIRSWMFPVIQPEESIREKGFSENVFINSTIQPRVNTLTLDKKCFNKWIKTHKPYLNSELKVEELASLYGVSTKELSAFLNREYRMNFNLYINRCRLVELRQLKAKHKGARLTQLVPMVGFGSMISYSRAKASIEKKKV